MQTIIGYLMGNFGNNLDSHGIHLKSTNLDMVKILNYYGSFFSYL